MPLVICGQFNFYFYFLPNHIEWEFGRKNACSVQIPVRQHRIGKLFLLQISRPLRVVVVSPNDTDRRKRRICLRFVPTERHNHRRIVRCRHNSLHLDSQTATSSFVLADPLVVHGQRPLSLENRTIYTNGQIIHSNTCIRFDSLPVAAWTSFLCQRISSEMGEKSRQTMTMKWDYSVITNTSVHEVWQALWKAEINSTEI